MDTVIVIPCFNEEKRFDDRYISDMFKHFEKSLHIIFVDDGSTDGTSAKLDRCRAAFQGVTILPLGSKSRQGGSHTPGIYHGL